MRGKESSSLYGRELRAEPTIVSMSQGSSVDFVDVQVVFNLCVIVGHVLGKVGGSAWKAEVQFKDNRKTNLPAPRRVVEHTGERIEVPFVWNLLNGRSDVYAVSGRVWTNEVDKSVVDGAP